MTFATIRQYAYSPVVSEPVAPETTTILPARPVIFSQRALQFLPGNRRLADDQQCESSDVAVSRHLPKQKGLSASAGLSQTAKYLDMCRTVLKDL
jgi:hypothetical protein